MNLTIFFTVVGWATIIFAAPMFAINLVVGYWINFTGSGKLHQLQLMTMGEKLVVAPALFKWGGILVLGIAIIASL